jgi:hypothetical protein
MTSYSIENDSMPQWEYNAPGSSNGCPGDMFFFVLNVLRMQERNLHRVSLGVFLSHADGVHYLCM